MSRILPLNPEEIRTSYVAQELPAVVDAVNYDIGRINVLQLNVDLLNEEINTGSEITTQAFRATRFYEMQTRAMRTFVFTTDNPETAAERIANTLLGSYKRLEEEIPAEDVEDFDGEGDIEDAVESLLIQRDHIHRIQADFQNLDVDRQNTIIGVVALEDRVGRKQMINGAAMVALDTATRNGEIVSDVALQRITNRVIDGVLVDAVIRNASLQNKFPSLFSLIRYGSALLSSAGIEESEAIKIAQNSSNTFDGPAKSDLDRLRDQATHSITTQREELRRQGMKLLDGFDDVDCLATIGFTSEAITREVFARRVLTDKEARRKSNARVSQIEKKLDKVQKEGVDKKEILIEPNRELTVYKDKEESMVGGIDAVDEMIAEYVRDYKHNQKILLSSFEALKEYFRTLDPNLGRLKGIRPSNYSGFKLQGKECRVFECIPKDIPGIGGGRVMNKTRVLFTYGHDGEVGILKILTRPDLDNFTQGRGVGRTRKQK